MSTRAILVTGFEPFGDQTVNASWEVASRLPHEIDGVRIIVRQLPVVYYRSIEAVASILSAEEGITDIILLGEAGGRTRISIEMIGVNLDDTDAPDNEGVKRENTKIYENAADGLFATIPVKDIVAQLTSDYLVPAYASWSAGQFLCNHTLYGVVHHTQNSDVRAGFVHLPYTSEQAAASARPGLSVTEMVRGIESIVKILIQTEDGSKH